MRVEDITPEHVNVDGGPIEDAMGQLAEQLRNQVIQQADVDLSTDEGREAVEAKVRELMGCVLASLGYID